MYSFPYIDKYLTRNNENEQAGGHEGAFIYSNDTLKKKIVMRVCLNYIQ